MALLVETEIELLKERVDNLENDLKEFKTQLKEEHRENMGVQLNIAKGQGFIKAIVVAGSAVMGILEVVRFLHELGKF
jgi:FtsZ-binding cell division protein ZapB